MKKALIVLKHLFSEKISIQQSQICQAVSKVFAEESLSDAEN